MPQEKPDLRRRPSLSSHPASQATSQQPTSLIPGPPLWMKAKHRLKATPVTKALNQRAPLLSHPVRQVKRQLIQLRPPRQKPLRLAGAS